ncbi:alanine--tRNA ligase [Pelagibaculum spongiae]|uniref:Alanine--tRNA ligase n=1 Tax=Pelagibaculum spongiae TaxID=2080658 RepID=A0A2V1H179_9GAMM|nr:alanine--tRNA ligase [Pelagibaculum spongiae]PVZ69782.1 alanine--tRNA ligase [Pelagibaculum spongiae]
MDNRFVSSADLREAFLNYFEERGHQRVPSSPLVPGNDPTLLFTNAGMVQFKDVFLGDDIRNYTRATTSQRCVRAGGKHNDLDNVGYTARHHTFFEMIGNFSFGDYFKREAIQYAWDFLTKEMGLPQEKLWITVYEDDQEAEDIWLKEMGVSAERFSRCGAKDNFWSMGDTGPCGPCSEIFYDHGADVAGGPPGTPEEDGDRYIEIWNMVFMQYDRDDKGVLTPLPKPCIDTGMGLERLAAVMQDVHNNYDIDLFQSLIKAVAKLADFNDLENRSLRVIADHIRSCAFLVVDGVVPSNEGRGYVLRRIIRRAVRHGHKLGLNDSFFFKLVAPLAKEMGQAFPELAESEARVEKVLRIEEEQFARTLDQGMKILEQAIAELEGKVLPGETVFKLYDTYGFPLDLTADICRERDLDLDQAGFDAEMAAQRARARAASNFAANRPEGLELEGKTEFTGYAHRTGSSQIAHLYAGDQKSEALSEGDQGLLILDQTPFYAESGGQAGDKGLLVTATGSFQVTDTTKDGGLFLHHGVVKSGSVVAGDLIEAKVDTEVRDATALNHSATHLLHEALRQLLGRHVTQKGSLNDSARLRFDFAHPEAVTAEELLQVERLVNRKIRENLKVSTEIMTPEQAQEKGAMALFGEKYGSEVRVLTMGDFSMELCGGTHVERTGDIGYCKIVSESGIAAGVRRIEAVTGEAAEAWVTAQSDRINSVSAMFKAAPDELADKAKQNLERVRELEKQLRQMNEKLASNAGNDLLSTAIDVEGVQLLVSKVEGDGKGLKDLNDQLKSKFDKGVWLLAAVNGDKVSLLAGVSKSLIKTVKAGDLVNFVAQQVGGKGGGRPDMAMAGGSEPAALDGALAGVEQWLNQRLAG